MALGYGLPVLLRLHGRRDRSVGAVPGPGPHPDLSVDRQARLQPDDGSRGRGDRAHEGLERGGAGSAFLRLLRSRRKPLAAPAEERMDREVQGQVRQGLERHARGDLRQPEAARRDPGQCEADSLAQRAADVGFAFDPSEEALRASGRGVCGLHGIHRLRDRPRHPGRRGHGQARQHLDHLHRRRQRDEPRRHSVWHVQSVHGLQRHPGRPRSAPVAAPGRLGFVVDLPAHGSGLGMGVRHAVQMDQASRLALRRNAAGPGHFVARPHQGSGRNSHPVPPHHRHRAHDPGGHGHQGAGDGRRHPAEADRGREHGVHLRREERRCALGPQDPVLRADEQPGDLPRRLVRQHDTAGAALGAEREDAGRQRLQVGALQHRRGLLPGR